MHYLMPDHQVLSPIEADAVLKALSIKIEELPALMYEDAALSHLRMKGEETPIDSVVKITVVRSKFSPEDSDREEARTKVKYRVIKGV
jgi:DNA-directed RNA polymerase subunit H (RpoH/RPB5)